MMKLCSDVLIALGDRTLVTAESCTGGGIGAALTAVPGSSANYKGGIICYTNLVKNQFLGVEMDLLDRVGAISAPVAEAMALGAKTRLSADVAISVTGLAGPGGDTFGNPVGTVYIGYSDAKQTTSKEFHFSGDRNTIRVKACTAALELVLEFANKDE